VIDALDAGLAVGVVGLYVFQTIYILVLVRELVAVRAEEGVDKENCIFLSVEDFKEGFN
jgi:hypothetical protein